MSRIVLSKIAKKIDNIERIESDERIFNYRQKTWQFLDGFETYLQLKKIIRLNEEGKFTKILDFEESGNYLLAVYKDDYITKNTIVNDMIDRLFESVFQSHAIKETFNADTNDSNAILKTYVTTKLFEALQRRHNTDEDANNKFSKLSLPAKFLPTLCNYQKKSVAWLLKKERAPEKFTEYFQKLVAKDNETVVFKHMYTRYIQCEQPTEQLLPPGGILAEEMGLGKTVEILALILLNPRINVNLDPRMEKYFQAVSAKRQENEDILCICTSKSHKKIIQCSKCYLWQHSKCVTSYNVDHDDEVNCPYLCPSCWPVVIEECGLINSKATFIVSPNSIKMQWLSEIRRHIQPDLRVLLYDGVIAGKWISPRQLSEYDIVLTDYNILRREIYYTDENVNGRTMRNKPLFMRVKTPILMINWWRVCLDEAQMVESNTSNVAALVRMLPAINRWAVTGTPIQRSLNDLQPLLKFLGFDAVLETNTWNHLVKDFLLQHQICDEDHKLELVNVLQKCMWRTCKSQVTEELQIPPQQQIVHHIQFNNLEKLFYDEKHLECKMNFMANVHKYKSRMSTISPKIMKLILMPFLTIRQSCTMPVIVVNTSTMQQQQQKNFLQPRELHNYLKTTNELSCKSELRAMASSHNGLAALYILEQKYDEAIKQYEAVLKLANDYNSMNVTVDSLLQIHALHNLMQAKIIQAHMSSACLEPYETQYNSLEWKYLSTYSNNLTTVMVSYNGAINKINTQIQENLIDSTCQALDSVSGFSLIQKIHEECSSRFDNVKLAEIQSTHTLLYVIDLWYTKLTKTFNALKKEVDNLKYFTDNVKSRNEVTSGTWRNMMALVHSVYDCHLSEIRDNEKEKKKKDKLAAKSKNKCKMCIMRDSINIFECLLFDKVIDETTNFTEGLENPSFEMFLCKITFSFLKNKLSEIEKNWSYLENLQIVCKRMIKLWIEMEYTIKAYDELDMCKMRISLTDDPEDEDKSIYKIHQHEIEQRIVEQQGELQSAQRQFTIKLARLKYIKHLEGDDEMGPCPICHIIDEDRYVVLECGHHICYQCLKSIQHYNRGSSFKCSVCRNTQHHQNIYYVSRSKANELKNQIVQGNYSSKITYIVRLILKLLKDDNDTEGSLKILIFSQWTPILLSIAQALEENDITFRTQCTPKTLEEFKNPNLKITCLLMPYVKGSKGLNIVEATHVFLVEPILNPGEELQAIGRVHRFGQTKPTTVHRFIMRDSIEENIHNFISSSANNSNGDVERKWEFENISLDDFEKLFTLKQHECD